MLKNNAIVIQPLKQKLHEGWYDDYQVSEDETSGKGLWRYREQARTGCGEASIDKTRLGAKISEIPLSVWHPVLFGNVGLKKPKIDALEKLLKKRAVRFTGPLSVSC